MEAQSWTYTNRQTGETVPMQVKVTCTGVNKDCPCDREHIGHQAKIYFTDEAGAPRIWLKAYGKLANESGPSHPQAYRPLPWTCPSAKPKAAPASAHDPCCCPAVGLSACGRSKYSRGKLAA